MPDSPWFQTLPHSALGVVHTHRAMDASRPLRPGSILEPSPQGLGKHFGIVRWNITWYSARMRSMRFACSRNQFRFAAMAKKKAAKKAPKKAAAKRAKTSTKQTARDPVGAPTHEQIQASFDGGKSYSATAYRELIGW